MSRALVPEEQETPGHSVKVQEAKTRLSSLLREVEAGHEITISRGSTPVARLVPVRSGPRQERRRPMGFLRLQVPDAFFEELPEEELDAWEGSA